MNGQTLPSHRVIPRRPGQRGASMMLIALLLLNLALVGVFAMSRAQSGYYRSIDLERRIEATYLAEAGINQGIERLYGLKAASLSLPFTLVASTSLGGGSYSALLMNNPGDPGLTRDTDNTFVVRATGISTGQTRKRVIDSTVQLTTLNLPPPPGTLVLGHDTTATLSGDMAINGGDSGGSAPAVAGVAFENLGQAVDESGSYSVTGQPDYEWASSDFSGDPGYSELAQRAIDILSTSPGSVHISGRVGGNIGTTTAPQVTVIDAGQRAVLSSTSGAGVLIVRGQLDIVGNFKFNGLILIEGDAVLEKTAGTATISGALVMTPPSNPTSAPADVLRLNGTSNINYSSTALHFSETLPWIQLRSYVTRN